MSNLQLRVPNPGKFLTGSLRRMHTAHVSKGLHQTNKRSKHTSSRVPDMQYFLTHPQGALFGHSECHSSNFLLWGKTSFELMPNFAGLNHQYLLSLDHVHENQNDH